MSEIPARQINVPCPVCRTPITVTMSMRAVIDDKSVTRDCLVVRVVPEIDTDPIEQHMDGGCPGE